MAQLLYGNVYFHDVFAGTLREQPNGRFAFTYDEEYLSLGRPAISHTLPLQPGAIESAGGLHPFFDNLVAEGWLANAQSRALGISREDRFGRLLAFGHDCAGAVAIIDPRPRTQPNLDIGTAGEMAALASRASISGVQPKLLAVKTASGYRPADSGEASTHIAKLPSGQLHGIVELEYLTTVAAAQLLSPDPVEEFEIAQVAGLRTPSLVVRRFDRFDDAGGERKIHFEEFNQLLERPSEAKYEGAYAEMAEFMRRNGRCDQADIDSLFRRLLAAMLLGNNDAHMKNFGLLYLGSSMRLAPVYDFVAAAVYPQYDSAMALTIGAGTNPRRWRDLGANHVLALAKSFGIGRGATMQAVYDLGRQLDAAEAAVSEAPHGKRALKTKLVQFMRKRWNAIFSSIGRK